MPGGKYKIKGKQISNFDSDIEVDIGAANDAEHEVISKDIPNPTPYNGGNITWFAAFGVRKKANNKFADITYTVTLSALPPGKTKLFALISGSPVELTTQGAGNGKIKFNLAVGDPPIGMWP